MSASQFICATLHLPSFPPPIPTRKNATLPAITFDTCWLCGAPLTDPAWPLATAMKQSSMNAADARASTSDGVCWPCMALRSAATWNTYVATLPHGHGMKQGKAIGWRNSSHLIASGLHLTPSRVAWRDILRDPPDPPFVAAFAVSTQLQILGLAEIAHDRGAFSLQLDRESIWLDRDLYDECLWDFEGLYNLGLTKAQISSGDIPNVPPYRDAREAWMPWLSTHRDLVRVVTLVAQRTEAS